MRQLSLLDLGFFIAETEASPKHVAGLLILKKPPRAPATFARKVYEAYLAHKEVKPPFNRVIRFSLTALPHWDDAATVDLEQHVFFHRLPAAACDRQALFDFVARLHEPLLDRRRPLWELHVIDGLDGGRFAIYNKMHHAYADGVTMARWTAQGLSESPADRAIVPLWSVEHSAYVRRREKRDATLWMQALRQLKDGSRRAVGIGRLGTMLLLEAAKLTKNAIALPFLSTARTPLTGQVGPGRRYAAAMVPMTRIDALRRRTRSTVNHIALACLDGALRRYLADLGVDLGRPLVVQMPVNLRRDGEKTAGNKIGIVQVELSKPTDDPYVRLREIGFSLRNVRTMIDSVAPEAIESYTVITGLAAQIAELLRLSNALPPLGNTLVSNVPGPKHTMYLMGATMEEMHPISTLPASNLLNITLFSYAGQMCFGLIATDELPELPRLADHIALAFDELEAAVRGAHEG